MTSATSSNIPDLGHTKTPAVNLDEEAFKRGLDAAQWPKLRAIVEHAQAHDECEACAVSEAKERGELIPLPRCATHYDRSLLTPLAVGGFRCNVCGQFVWPRETVRPSEK